MLWKVENFKSHQKVFLVPGRTYVVGRQDADLIINDKSVSRKHAKISFDSEKKMLFVEDLSKFGTTINSVSLINKSGYIKNGDKITFGAQPGVDFQCSIIKFNLLISTLIHAEKIKLNQYIGFFGGKLLNDWDDDVGYLIMSSLKVTYKVICALIKQIPIVTTDFIKDLHDYYTGVRLEEPQSNDYLPATSDVNIVDKNISFKADINRTTLFSGKTFYFLSTKKMSHLELAITSAGGKTVLITEVNFGTVKNHLNSANNIVMYETVENSLVKEVYILLKCLRKRPVIDSEIGFAVLHVSTEEYCNPDKVCVTSIYKDTHLTQILSVNPFHMDVDEPRSILDVNKEVNVSHKRAFIDDDKSVEMVPKHRKISLDKSQEKISFNSSLNLKRKTKNDEKKLGNTKENIISFKESPIKKKSTLQNFLTDNNTFFAKNTESFTSDRKIPTNFDDEFDQLEIPDVCTDIFSVIPKMNSDVTLISEHNIQIIEKKLKELQCEEKQKTFCDQPIELVPAKIIVKSSCEIYPEEKKKNIDPGLKERMTRSESLVVDNLVEVGRNFKTFRKISPVFINYDVVPMDIFRKVKC